jgi:riboflavin biosynthesis pyrimidine reductase
MGMRSVLVEGGPETIRQCLTAGLWDELRLAHSPRTLGTGLPGPELSPDFAELRGEHSFGEDRVEYWLNPSSSTWVGSCPPPTLSIPLPS